MMYSQNRKEYIETRAVMLEAMQICLRTGNLDEAKSIGESARKLKDKIEKHDYSKDSIEQARQRIRHNGFTPQYL